MYYMGIDIGSLSCDAVIIDENEQILAAAVVPTGAQNKEAIRRAKDEVMTSAGIESQDISATVSTGYGRDRVENRLKAVTEITCHARGIKALQPDVDLLIDIGGQDSKSILLDGDGNVTDFAMNDKCAAGTGRFLEAMARALEVDIDQLGDLDHDACQNLTISSMCTVFAESEVVSLIADGAPVNEIARGINRSIATRTLSLVKRIAPTPSDRTVAMSGGVARNSGVVNAIETVLGCALLSVPELPDTIGALGAALIARDKSNGKNR